MRTAAIVTALLLTSLGACAYIGVPPLFQAPLLEYRSVGGLAGDDDQLTIWPDGRGTVSTNRSDGRPAEFNLPPSVLGALRKALGPRAIREWPDYFRECCDDVGSRSLVYRPAGRELPWSGKASGRGERLIHTIVSRGGELVSYPRPYGDRFRELTVRRDGGACAESIENLDGGDHRATEVGDVRLSDARLARLEQELEVSGFAGKTAGDPYDENPESRSRRSAFRATYDFQTATAPSAEELPLSPAAVRRLEAILSRAVNARGECGSGK